MLLAQTQRDRKETCARNSVRTLNMKYTLEFVFIEHYAMLFCQLRKWPHVHMTGCVYRPVRPLVLIYNSMTMMYMWTTGVW